MSEVSSSPSMESIPIQIQAPITVGGLLSDASDSVETPMPLEKVPPEEQEPPKVIRHPRIVVIETIHHVAPGQKPHTVTARYDRWLDTDEEPFPRRFTGSRAAGPDWRPLIEEGRCWVEKAGRLHLENLSSKPGAGMTKLPSDEEKKLAGEATIELGIKTMIRVPAPTMRDHDKVVEAIQPIAFIRPGETAHYEPADLRSLFIRCRVSRAEYALTVFPQ